MPTIYPLIGEPYEISADEDAQMRETYKAEFEGSRKRRDRELAEAKQAAAYQADLDAIDKMMAEHLSRELRLENAKTRVRAADKETFRAFQLYCERWGFPALPTPPQAVAVFRVEQSEKGAAHLARLARGISVIHLACNFSDPTTDILVRSLLRRARTEKPNSPQEKEQN